MRTEDLHEPAVVRNSVTNEQRSVAIERPLPQFFLWKIPSEKTLCLRYTTSCNADENSYVLGCKPAELRTYFSKMDPEALLAPKKIRWRFWDQGYMAPQLTLYPIYRKPCRSIGRPKRELVNPSELQNAVFSFLGVYIFQSRKECFFIVVNTPRVH